LRLLGRKAPDSLGRKWFVTSTAELLQLIDECDLFDLPSDRLIAGADETLEGGFAELMAGGLQRQFRSSETISSTFGWS
jgi:hypothetical protein